MLNQILSPVLNRLPENNRLERIWILAKVDFTKRYYDNSLGLLWALINPIFKVFIYYIAFTMILNHGMDNFALYLFSGLLFYMFFSESTKKGINIFKAKKYLIENIKFNKIDLFISSTFSVLLAFMFNISAYFIVSLLSGISITINILYLPILVFTMFLVCLSVSMFLACINIYLKDINHLWDLVILGLFWVTPIVYRPEMLTGNFEILLYINPIAGIIVNLRNVALDGVPPDFFFLWYNLGMGVILFGIAYLIFPIFSHKAAEKF